MSPLRAPIPIYLRDGRIDIVRKTEELNFKKSTKYHFYSIIRLFSIFRFVILNKY